MKAATQLLAATAILAAVGAGVWWSVERDEGPRAAVPPEAPAELAEPREPVAPPARSEEASPPARKEIEAVRAPETKEGAAPEAALPTLAAGRCVDEQLLPVALARVSQLGSEPARGVTSATDGRFELECAPDRRGLATLIVEAAGFATASVDTTLRPGEATQVGDVILAPGGSVRGRVLGPDGSPFSGATVYVTEADLWAGLEELRVGGPLRSRAKLQVQPVTSSGDGRFEVEGVAVGPRRVWAGAEGMRYSISSPVEFVARGTIDEVELRLEPLGRDDRITGFVILPDGEPFRGARVNVFGHSGRGGGSSPSVLVDDEGRFEIIAKVNYLYDLSVLDPQNRWAGVSLRGVAPGTHDLELRFAEPRWIEVRVRAAGGEPVEEFELTAFHDTDRVYAVLEQAKGERHPDGRARLRVPNELFEVQVDARGFALDKRGPFRPGEEPAELEFELDPVPGVRGRVLADGKPLPGAKVTLHDAGPGMFILRFGLLTFADPRPGDSATTDAEGRFVLKLREATSYVVRAEAEGFAPADTAPIALDPATGKDDLELVLGKGGALEGRVLVRAGRDPAGQIVALNRGDGFPRTVRSDEEGRFLFEGLMPGPWHLSLSKLEANERNPTTSYGFTEEPIVIPFNCTVREGETTVQDLDLRDFEPCELAGVLLVNGAPVAGWGVSAWPGARPVLGGPPPSTATATDGTFSFTIDEAGPLKLALSPPAELGVEGSLEMLTEIRPGENEQRFDLATGRLTGRCLSPVGPDVQTLFYYSAEGVVPSCGLTIVPDAEGRYVLPFVPAGKGTIRRLGPEGERPRWTTLVETDVPARAERVLDIP